MRSFLFTAALLITVFISGCRLNNVQGSTNEIVTEEDLLAATQILGESISTANGGVVLSINDALALLSEFGYNSNSAAKKKLKNAAMFDVILNLEMNHNPDTGFFTVTFQRMAENGTKSEMDTLQYIFRDLEGEEIMYPREQLRLIETIRFSDSKRGEIFSDPEYSTYIRQNELFITEILSDSVEYTFPVEGTHAGQGRTGQAAGIGDDVQYYEVAFDFLNVIIQGELGPDGYYSRFSAHGGLTFEIEIWESEEKQMPSVFMDGTITFNGDGTALIRYRGITERFQVNIETGEIIPS